jgi:hypothetical protein
MTDLQVFDAWLELASGAGTEPRALPIAAAPLLGVILETLLGLHEFETFETVTKLLARCALPAREQRELLGSMYLNHGFLASAAQEWMAVCQTAPDARALFGLARVAARHGQLEDAAVFAGEAVKLDPNNVAAQELLRRCQTEQGSTLAA